MEALAQVFNELNARGVLTTLVIFGIVGMLLTILGKVPLQHPIDIQGWRQLALGCFSLLLLLVGIFGFLFLLVVTTSSILSPQPTQIASEPQATQLPILTTQIQPTQPVPTQILPTAAIPSAFCQQTITEDSIPSGGTQELIINPDEFHLWSSGDICVSYGGGSANCVVGDVDKGFITVFRPVNNQITTYQLSRLVPRNNWHGVYQDCSYEQQLDWIDNRANALSHSPNCADGNGCGEIYIRIFEGNLVDQRLYTVEN